MTRSFVTIVALALIALMTPASGFLAPIRIAMQTPNANMRLKDSPSHFAFVANKFDQPEPPLPEDNQDELEGYMEAVRELGPLAVQMLLVLSVKTVKDLFEYPPMWFDEWALEQGEGKTHPITMLFKFIGVLLFKGLHDVTYFPMVWSQRLFECQSLEECQV